MRTAFRFASVCLVVLPFASEAAPKRDKADRAADNEVERLEVAREHFMRGEALEKDGRLEEALVEYEVSDVAHPSPSVAATKARLRETLAARATPVPREKIVLAPAPVERRRPLSRFVAPIVIAPLAIGALVAGGAVLAVEKHDFDHLKHTCAPGCASSDVNPLETRQTVGYALLGAGAGLAAIDIVLWAVLAGRHDRAPRDVAFVPSLTGISGQF